MKSTISANNFQPGGPGGSNSGAMGDQQAFHHHHRQPRSWTWLKRKHMDFDSWEEQVFAEDAAGALGGCVWPPRSYSCTFCRREFRSAQALGGHMNVHRRDRARLQQAQSLNDHSNPCKPSSRVSASAGTANITTAVYYAPPNTAASSSSSSSSTTMLKGYHREPLFSASASWSDHSVALSVLNLALPQANEKGKKLNGLGDIDEPVLLGNDDSCGVTDLSIGLKSSSDDAVVVRKRAKTGAGTAITAKTPAPKPCLKNDMRVVRVVPELQKNDRESINKVDSIDLELRLGDHQR